MISLIIDTATKYLYVGLVKDDKLIDEHISIGAKNHAGMSVYSINEMLKANKLTCDDIKRVYCGAGPGSYTGVRISVTIAKMLASFKPIQLYAVSSLFLAASGYSNKNVAVMFDARRGNCFCAVYGENEIVDKLRNRNDFIEQISNFNDLQIVEEDNFKVNPIKVMERAILVEEVNGFVPNYLRIPEAQYNLEHKDD